MSSALTDLFTSIANAIRTKTGSSAQIVASNFPTEIANIPSGGSIDWSEYITDPYLSERLKNISTAIKKIPPITVKPRSNNSISYLFNQMYGLENIDNVTIDLSSSTRLDISYVFYYCTELDENSYHNFINKITVPISSVSNAFRYLTWSTISLYNLDTSIATNWQYAFANCTHTTVLDLTNASFKDASNISNMFYSSSGLTTILGGFQDLGKNYTSSTANYNNYKLDLSMFPNLTHDSLVTVIGSLFDLATAGKAAQSLVLGSTNLAKLTSAEIAVATNKGWNVS